MATKKTTTTKSRNNKVVSKTTSKNNKVVSKRTVTRTPITTYIPVSENIYHDGSSYRVRVSVNGTKYSKNFSSKKKALAYRKELFASR